jgi:ABC-2 type transport system ATP-binding protein
MALLEARNLGLQTRRGWVFRGVDLDVEPGELVAIVGPAASGRTSLLLALGDRFKVTDGTLTRHGTTALAHVPGVTDPDPNLTVAENLEERLILTGHARRGRKAAARRMTDRPDVLGRDLTPLDRHRLGLVAARLTDPDLVLADDVDAGLSAAEREQLLTELRKLTADGVAVVVTAREVEPGTVERQLTLEATR